MSVRILEEFGRFPGRWWTVGDLVGVLGEPEGAVLRTLHRLDGYGRAFSRLTVEGVLWTSRENAEREGF